MTTKVLTPPTEMPVTLADVRRDLRDPDVGLNNQITSFIVMATGEAERYLQRSLMPRQRRVTLDSFPLDARGGPGVIELDCPPIISVDSIQFRDPEGVTRTLDPADYIADTVSEPGWVVIGIGKAWPATQDRIGAATVDYTSGYIALPEEIQYAIRARVVEMFNGKMKSEFFPECLHTNYKVYG